MENVSFRNYCKSKGIKDPERERFWNFMIKVKGQVADEDFPISTAEKYSLDYEEFKADVTEDILEGIEIMSQKQIEAVLEEIC